VPVPELDLDLPAVLGGHLADLGLGGLGLLPVARVHENVRRVSRNDKALAECLLEVVAQLPGRQTLGQRVRPAVLEQPHL